MGTMISIQVLSGKTEAQIRPALKRAMGWFALVEETCSRFDPRSELRRLTVRWGNPVVVSALLFEVIRFSLALARQTRGAFDPTVGATLESHGFNRHYATGEVLPSHIPANGASYRDVTLGARRRTVMLRRPLLLDLGGVAKGFAIDLAALELSEFDGFCVDAGGDVFVGGRGPQGERWRIGVQHPRQPGVLCVLRVRDQAVGTSGDYERPAPEGEGHHIIDPRNGRSPGLLASATVVAPTALVADGLSTAAMLLGPAAGARLLEKHGLDGVLITSAGETRETAGFARLLA